MKKILTITTIFVLTTCNLLFATQSQSMTLKTGISLSDQVPKGLFGHWEVTSTIKSSNNPSIFNETSKDFWNLSKIGDVITLSNPISGAEASVTLKEVDGNTITFTHVIEGKSAKMIETPTLRLEGEFFSGTDKIVLERYKYGKKISQDEVIYNITAKKISGSSALSILEK